MTNKKYLSLITSQHRKPKFVSTVQASIDPLIDCIDFLESINDGFDLESATDLPLQIIAEWVGAANSIPNSIPIAFFGFAGQQGSLPMRETNDPTFVSGYWRESGVSGFRALSMSKDLFKKVVKAKIKLNHSDCTIDSAKEIMEMVLDKGFKIKDNLDMTVTFSFLENYDVSDRELVKLMFPLPSGVKLIFEDENDY